MYLFLHKSPLNSFDVGNKAKNLKELIINGLNVPNALILPISFFLDVKFDNQLEQLSKKLDFILPSKDGWAIRSSSTNEDSLETSLAGKYKTIIIHSKYQLREAIIEVLHSSDKKNGMGVIVQKYIQPNLSGIVFSKNPVNNSNGIVIEMHEGKGETIVNGLVTPWMYDDKATENDFNHLSKNIINNIKQDVELMKNKLGFDIDMEFCIKDGILYWLQVRPISKSQFHSEPSNRIELTGDWFLFDQCTEPVAPLLQKLDPSGLFNSKFWDTIFVNNYPYIKMKKINSVNNASLDFDILEEWFCLQGKYEPLFDYFLNEKLKHEPLKSLWDKLQKRMEVYRNYCNEYMNREWIIKRFTVRENLENLIKDAYGEDINVDIEMSKLINGIESITLKKHLLLEELVTTAKQLNSFNTVIENIELYPTDPWVKKFMEFINEYGFECSHALICTTPTLAEDQDSLLKLIKNMVNNQDNSHSRFTNESDWKKQADLIEKKLPTVKRSKFITNLKIFRESLIRTENDDYLLQKGAASIRYILLQIGSKLCEKKILKNKTQIFFLLPKELKEAIENPDSYLIEPSTINNRLREYEHSKREAPSINLFESNTNTLNTKILSGNIASPGYTEGIVYVINNPLDRVYYENIPINAVVVAPVLAPSLVYNLISVSAIITEVGGFLSHGAIFSREKNIPSIVAVNSVTKKLKTGDRVKVDANKGLIEVLEKFE